MVKLVIFDMDGLLLDSERTYLNCVKTVCQARQTPINEDFLISLMGMNYKSMKAAMIDTLGPDFDYDAMMNEYQRYRKSYEVANPPAIKPGLFALLDHLKKEGIATAIATSTYRQRALEVLDNSRLDVKLFDYLKSGDEVQNGKPDPEIFEAVLEHFGVKPQEALIFEDSQNGLLAALAAQVPCVIVPDIAKIRPEILSQAHAVIKDLSEGICLIHQDK